MEVLRNIRTVRQLTKENDFIISYEALLLEPHRFVIFHWNILLCFIFQDWLVKELISLGFCSAFQMQLSSLHRLR